MDFLSSQKICLTISENGFYCTKKGIEICNFFIRPINVLTLYGTDSVEKDFYSKLRLSRKTSTLEWPFLSASLAIQNG